MKSNMLFLFFLLILFSNAPASNVIPADHPHIQYFGRWDFSNPAAPSHSWPGVYLIAKFEGTRIGARFNDNFNYYNVFIDGALHSIFHGTTSGTADYTLASGLADGQHTLRLSKRSETGWASHTFYGFLLDEGKSLLEPDARPERKIEFIGDSFTSASGNEAPTNDTPPDVAKVTNIDEGFGPIIARHFGAQYHSSSISGYGMVLDWQGNFSNNLPDRFARTNIQTKEPVWDFEQWIPNLVVVGLGLNDYSGFGGWEGTLAPGETELYKTRYHEFLATIRDVYPGVKILAVATHVEWMRTTISEIVNEENEAGHADVAYAQYSYYEGGYVNNGHPNVATHHGIARELIPYIESINPWEPYIDTTPPVFTTFPDSMFVSYQKNLKINVVTDTYASVKYDFSDKTYAEMAFTFDVTGKRIHSLNFFGEHGLEYTLFVRAADANANATPLSLEIKFRIDTTKVRLNWNDLKFDDTDWGTGKAKFGLQASQGTVTALNDVNTVYFRKIINVDNPATITGIGILLKGSDAAAVYLNGVELGRINFFDGAVLEYATPAMASSALNKMFIITDSGFVSLLRPGENMIAVEMHRAAQETKGIAFDSQMMNQKNQIIYSLGSEWQYYDQGNQPESQIVDVTASVRHAGSRPIEFGLEQNYPNPFNPTTRIHYDLPVASNVDLDIYNSLGQKVCTLVSEQQMAGTYSVQWDASDFASGLYLFKLSTNHNWVQTKKLLLLK